MFFVAWTLQGALVLFEVTIAAYGTIFVQTLLLCMLKAIAARHLCDCDIFSHVDILQPVACAVRQSKEARQEAND